MPYKKISQQEYNDLKSDNGHVCPQTSSRRPFNHSMTSYWGEHLSFVVGRVYTFQNPSNKAETIQGICTQNSPYAILLVGGKRYNETYS